MNALAKVLTDYVVYKGMVKDDERTIYEYGFIIALETMLSLIISFGIASILHMVVEGVLFFLIFIPLRSYAGGLHLDCYLTCLSLSCLIFSVVLLIVKLVNLHLYFSFLLFIVLVFSVWWLHPVDHINRVVDEDEELYFRRRLKFFLVIDVLISTLCVVTKRKQYLSLIVVTLLMIVITMILGKLKNSRATSREKGNAQ